MAKIRIPRILSALHSQPWAVTPPTLQAIRSTLDRYATARVMDDYEDAEEREPDPTTHVSGSVGLVLISGIIGQHLSMLEMDCGGYDVGKLSDDLDKMGNDASVSSVLLAVRSPGGTVTGVPEAATLVAEFDRTRKPVHAMTDDMAASAAYWIASQARSVMVTPSSEVGSIGVYSALVDESAAWAKDGYKLELMKAGKHKAAGISGLPLDPEDRAMIQASVDSIYGEFTAAVRAGRKRDIADEVMQGQMFRGEAAIAAGLADELVINIADAVEKIRGTR